MNGLDAYLQPPDDYYGTDDPEPCAICDDTGEVWVDVELPSGRVREDMHVCGCGA